MNGGEGPIVVPTDFSSCAVEAWGVARRLARALGGELVLVHVLVEAPLFSEGPLWGSRATQVYEAARRWAEREIEGWAEEGRAVGLAVRATLRTGVPFREIVEVAAAEKAGLVVLGTHGRGGLNRALLGSVADRVIRTAPCPVLTVRQREGSS